MHDASYFAVEVRLPEAGMQEMMQAYRAHVDREDAAHADRDPIPVMSTNQVDNDAGLDGVRCPYIMDSMPPLTFWVNGHKVTANTTITYRLYEERDGELYPVQHKTRTPIRLGEWMEADVKTARDGSGNRWYKTGFHSVLEVADAVAYIRNFRSESRRSRMRVVECEVADTWRKQHSNADILLARYMKVNRILSTQEVNNG